MCVYASSGSRRRRDQCNSNLRIRELGTMTRPSRCYIPLLWPRRVEVISKAAHIVTPTKYPRSKVVCPMFVHWPSASHVVWCTRGVPVVYPWCTRANWMLVLCRHPGFLRCPPPPLSLAQVPATVERAQRKAAAVARGANNNLRLRPGSHSRASGIYPLPVLLWCCSV